MAKVDTRGLTENHLGKRLLVQLATGELEEVIALELTVCDPPEPCCGLTYRMVHASRPSEAKAEGSVYWVVFDQIENFQELGDCV